MHTLDKTFCSETVSMMVQKNELALLAHEPIQITEERTKLQRKQEKLAGALNTFSETMAGRTASSTVTSSQQQPSFMVSPVDNIAAKTQMPQTSLASVSSTPEPSSRASVYGAWRLIAPAFMWLFNRG